MSILTKKLFDELENKDFEIKINENNNESFSLIEIKSVNSHTTAEGQAEPFALLFQSNNETIYDQGIYTLKNIELNEINIFLVPIGSNETGTQYEAVFT